MSRADWIVGIIAGLIISAIGIVFLVFAIDSPDSLIEPKPMMQPAAKSNVTFSSSTSSMQAFEIAKDEATKWQPDAVLVKANTTWPNGTTHEKLLAGAESWSLGFYSPGTHSAANFEVIDKRANLVNEFTVQTSSTPEEIGHWRIDSGVAVYRWLDEGGTDFLNRNGIGTMTMSLSAGFQDHRPEWVVLVLSARDADTLTMRMDASTGEILETESS